MHWQRTKIEGFGESFFRYTNYLFLLFALRNVIGNQQKAAFCVEEDNFGRDQKDTDFSRFHLVSDFKIAETPRFFQYIYYLTALFCIRPYIDFQCCVPD